MGSLDVDSFFTNIPLDETIDICVNQFFENTDTVEGFTKSELKQLLCLATKESYFIFNGLLYKHIDGVAMGSPLGPSFANAFLSYHEKTCLNNCPQGFKPVFYCCVNDISILFKLNDHLQYFQHFLIFLRKQKKRASYLYLMLKLYTNKTNLQQKFIGNLLLVAYIVTLKVFYLQFINLVCMVYTLVYRYF